MIEKSMSKFPACSRELSFLQSIHTSSDGHTTSYLISTGDGGWGHFPRSKAAGVGQWPLVFWCPGQVCKQLYHLFICPQTGLPITLSKDGSRGSSETTVKFYQTIWHLTTSSNLQMSNKTHKCVCVCVCGVKYQNLNFKYISSYKEALPFSAEPYTF
jgi:hypothetical protein